MQGWTCFNASSNGNIKKPWWHSSEAISFGKEAKDSHSGNGHLMSNTSLMTTQYAYPIDNYLVSPVKVKVTENSTVSFYARAHHKQYYQEHFGVAISTTNNTLSIYGSLVASCAVLKDVRVLPEPVVCQI